jgi:hypothetical protein
VQISNCRNYLLTWLGTSNISILSRPTSPQVHVCRKSWSLCHAYARVDFPSPALHVLKDALDAINEASVTKQLQDRIAELIELAHGKMSSAPSQAALYQWRRVHTDASITRAVFFLGGTTHLDAISSLDTAIIISGAAGNDRLNLIQSLIKDIQIRYAPAQPFTSQLNHPERDDIVNDHLESAAHQVPQLESPPSILTFQSNFFREPFVLRGYARGWPAMQERPWHSASYLRSIAGVGRVVPVEVGSDYRSDDWSQKIVPWDEFLSALDFADQPCSSTADVMYLAQHNLFMQFPSLWSDIIIPDYVYADLNCSDHTPPQNDEKLVINVWLGPRGTVSPAHTVCAALQRRSSTCLTRYV